MKPHLLPLVLFGLLSPLVAAEPDPVEAAFRDAWKSYKEGNSAATSAKLREILKILDQAKIEEANSRAAAALADQLGEWKGEAIQKSERGKSVSFTRRYTKGDRAVVAAIKFHDPRLDEVGPILANPQTLEFSGRQSRQVNGLTALVEGDSELMLVPRPDILVDLLGGGSTTLDDLAEVAGQIDLKSLGEQE